jgi:hypothetical protein
MSDELLVFFIGFVIGAACMLAFIANGFVFFGC